MQRYLFRRLSAIVSTAALLSATTNAAFATCSATQIAGAWRLYVAEMKSPAITVQNEKFKICTLADQTKCPNGIAKEITVTNTLKSLDENIGSVNWCSINLTVASASPIKLSMSGTCHTQSELDLSSGTATVSANKTILGSTSCVVNGTFVLSVPTKPPVTITILDAKIDPSHNHGTGVARYPRGTLTIGTQTHQLYATQIFHLQR